jgi:signal transduction histidine kinase
MEVEVTSEGVSENLPDEYKTCIYRVAQEALHNASRHASARNAHVHVRQANGKLQISIEDDGRGFDPGTRGMGLLGMEERIKRLGGQLVIDSAPGQGTRLSAEIPLANDSQDRTGT